MAAATENGEVVPSEAAEINEAKPVEVAIEESIDEKKE